MCQTSDKLGTILTKTIQEIYFHLRRYSERECRTAILIRDGKISFTDDIHADDYIVFVAVKFHCHNIRHKIQSASS